MKRCFLFLALSTFAGGIMSAAPIPCPVTDNLQDLISMFPNSGTSCFSQDKLFWGFSYTPGGNAPAAGQVQSTLIFQTSPAIDIHGWSFTGDWEQAGRFLSNFTLAYSMQVCNVAPCLGNVSPGELITAADAIYAPSALTGAGSETVNWSNGASTTLTSSSPGPLPVGADIGFSGGGPITVTAAFSGSGTITGTSLRFYESAVPEPATLGVLFGGLALIAMIFVHRRHNIPKYD